METEEDRRGTVLLTENKEKSAMSGWNGNSSGSDAESKAVDAEPDAAFATDCAPYSLVGEDFEASESIFQDTNAVLDSNDMDQMNETMKKCTNEHFRKLLPTMREYRRKICNMKVAYRQMWKDGELKEGGKKSDKLPEGYLLLCLFSDRFCGSYKATLLQICKDLKCDIALYKAVKKWGWESVYPLITEEKSTIKLSSAMSPDVLKSILFIARVYYALEAMGDGTDMTDDLYNLIRDLLFKIEKESETLNRNGDNRRRKAATAKESRKKSKSNNHESAGFCEIDDRNDMQPPFLDYDEVKRKRFLYKHPSKFPAPLEESEEDDDDESAVGEETIVLDDRKPAAKSVTKTTKDNQPSPIMAKSKRKSVPKKKSLPEDCSLHARFDQIEKALNESKALAETGLEALQQLRQAFEYLEERTQKLDQIEKLMRK